MMQPGDYVLEPSDELNEFLKNNGFEYDSKFENYYSEYSIVINIVYKTYFKVQKYFITTEKPISCEEFFKRINYSEDSIYRKLHSDNGELLYEGYTLKYAPYGLGVLYYANGNKYLEGVFNIKGIKQGKEYYPSGQVKFEGDYALTPGYGPNAPSNGRLYSEDGELIYSGKFEIKRGGVGYPMIRYPTGYKRATDSERPKIDFYRGR